MVSDNKEVEFDPGFAPYIMAFQGTVEYLYSDINRFKNLSQKKIKFMQYYKKSQPKAKIASNSFLGTEYNEAENVADIDYVIQFIKLFPKDMKYFLGQTFEFDENIVKLAEIYKEFLIINKGFTNSEYNSDILIPDSIAIEKAEEYKKIIDTAIEEGNLSKLKDSLSIILK